MKRKETATYTCEIRNIVNHKQTNFTAQTKISLFEARTELYNSKILETLITHIIMYILYTAKYLNT